jgi:probable F420-dependent oxidoreductase
VKVRIGVGLGANALLPGDLGPFVDALDRLDFDSLWLSEVLTGPVLDPLVGLAWAAAHNQRLKLGTTMLLPGRNPLRLAKELATVDTLSQGRLLVTFVPGLTHPPERDAIGVAPKERGAAMDEVMPLLRRLWAGQTVTHHGAAASFDDVTLSPLPCQQPLEMWLGGMAPASLERCGRLSDGWLPSLLTPDEAADGRQVINTAAARAGRQISQEHFGVSVGYASRPLDEHTRRALTARVRRAPTEVMPVGMRALRALLERYIAVGFSKFVVRPLVAPDGWRAELEQLADGVGDLQT